MTTPKIDQAITDESIAAMREDLRRPWKSQGWNSTVSYDAIWHFAHGVGDDNPLWWDRDYAERAAGRMFAPPTFFYSCENAPLVPGLMQLEEKGGVETWLPGALGLWASDRWIWHDRAWISEEIEAVCELWDVQERRSSFSGRSVAQTTRSRYSAGDGRLIAELFRTIFRFERSALSPDRYMHTPPPQYTEADREMMQERYLAEAANRRGAEPRYFEDVNIGDTLPALLKGPLTITALAAWVMGWGSPMCQSHRIAAGLAQERPGAMIVHPQFGFPDTIEGPHWDGDLAVLGGFPRGYDFGSQRLSWLVHCVTDWCGDQGFLTEFNGRLLRPNLLGDMASISGHVTGKTADADTPQVTCQVEAKNQRDEVTATAEIEVALPSRSRSGG